MEAAESAVSYFPGQIWDFAYLPQDAEINHAVEIAGWGQEADGNRHHLLIRVECSIRYSLLDSPFFLR